MDVAKDLNKKVQPIPLDEVNTNFGGATLLKRELATAGIAYVDLALDLKNLLDIDDEVPLMPIFARMLTETGITDKFDAVKLHRRIGAETGGIQCLCRAFDV